MAGRFDIIGLVMQLIGFVLLIVMLSMIIRGRVEVVVVIIVIFIPIGALILIFPFILLKRFS